MHKVKGWSLVNLLVLWAILLSFSSAPVWAQAEATTGSIRGVVTDPSGASIPNAKVLVKNHQNGFTRDITTEADGYYLIPLLPVGVYEVRMEAAGFSPVVESKVVVNIGRAVTLNVQMKVGAATQVIEVTAGAALVETTRTQQSSVVDEASVRELPVHGRNYLDFILLTPGVARDNNRAGDISFGGLKGTYNSLQIDGVDNNNNFFGQALGRTGVRAPFQFSQEAVAEFQVKANSYTAEYGRAGGAVINVVTKSGANDFHGAGFFYFRDNAMNAGKWENNRAGRVQPFLRVWQFGTVASGPVVKDRAFWLFNYDAQRRSDPNPILCPSTTGAVAAACATAAANSFLGPRIVDYQKKLDQDVYLGKFDWRVSANHHLSIRYNYQRFTGGAQENSGSTSVLEHTGDSLVRTHTLSGNFISTFGPHWLNEFRAQWGRDSEPGQANATDPEAVLVETGTTFLNIGRNNFSPRETTIKRGQFVDTASWLLSKHTIRFGADFNIERILNFFPGLFGGSYRFNSLADFLDNRRPDGSAAGSTVGTYSQAFAGSGTTGPTTHPDITEYAWFVQDDWRIAPTLTLSFGVRYDLQTNARPSLFNPSPQLAALGVDTSQMNRDTNNWGPRFGWAWSPRMPGRWPRSVVFRGGYGFYYARTPAIPIATAISNNGLQVISLTFAGNSALLPAGFAYPTTLSAIPSGATIPPANVYAFQSGYVQPYVQQGSFGVEAEIARDWSVGLNYLFVKGTHLTRSNDINLNPPVLTAFNTSNGGTILVERFPATRPATNFVRVTQFQSTANSNYHAGAFTLNKRFGRMFFGSAMGTVSYTFSKAIDDRPDSTSVVPGNAGDDFKVVSNPLNFREDRGPSDQDFQHRFIVTSHVEFDRFNKSDNFLVRHLFGHWAYSTITQIQNGKRYSIQLGGDPNRNGNIQTDRAFGIGRNTERLPRQWSSDIRVQHDFPVHEKVALLFQFEAFNLWNRPNFRDINNIQYNFATASAATATTSCPVGTSCFFPVAAFTAPNVKDRFVGTYDHPGGGSNFPGPGPRTLQLALKVRW